MLALQSQVSKLVPNFPFPWLFKIETFGVCIKGIVNIAFASRVAKMVDLVSGNSRDKDAYKMDVGSRLANGFTEIMQVDVFESNSFVAIGKMGVGIAGDLANVAATLSRLSSYGSNGSK